MGGVERSDAVHGQHAGNLPAQSCIAIAFSVAPRNDTVTGQDECAQLIRIFRQVKISLDLRVITPSAQFFPITNRNFVCFCQVVWRFVYYRETLQRNKCYKGCPNIGLIPSDEFYHLFRFFQGQYLCASYESFQTLYTLFDHIAVVAFSA